MSSGLQASVDLGPQAVGAACWWRVLVTIMDRRHGRPSTTFTASPLPCAHIFVLRFAYRRIYLQRVSELVNGQSQLKVLQQVQVY